MNILLGLALLLSDNVALVVNNGPALLLVDCGALSLQLSVVLHLTLLL